MRKLTIIALALGASAIMMMQAAHADCIRVRFDNESGKTIRHLYVSPSTFGRWGNDVLGSDVIYPGDAEAISVCFNSNDDNYDFKAVYNDGSSDEWREGVNIVGSATVWADHRRVLHWR